VWYVLVLASSLALADVDWKRREAELAKLEPSAAVATAETWLADDPPEATRRTLLASIVAAAETLASDPTADELEWIERTRPLATPFTCVLKSRYALVLANDTFAAHARESRLLGEIDAAYALERALFAVDPVATRGRRMLFFCERGRPGPWMTNSDIPRVHMPEGYADDGRWTHHIAHEINHPFGHDHPARELFGGGLFEGWADLMHAFTAEQMGCIEPILANTFGGWRDEIRRCGRVEYLETRLPFEEIVNYTPSSALLLELALAAGDGSTPNWAPWRRALRATSSLRADDGAFWPERFTTTVRAAFGDETALPVLATYRTPIDRGVAIELARRDGVALRPRAERWAALGEIPVRAWRVLGPIPDRETRHVDFDPLDAENFAGEHALDFGGARYEWRTAAPIDADGFIDLAASEGGAACSVDYLHGSLGNRAAGRATLLVSSDDDVSLWIDGEFVHTHRGARGVTVDSPDRVVVALARPNAEVLALVANYWGSAGFALRLDERDPYAGALAELQSGDETRAIAAAGWLATRRSAARIAPLKLVASHHLPRVRAIVARGLGGARNDAEVVEALIDRFGKERDASALAAIRAALGELCFVEFADFHAARASWREHGKAWALGDFAEAELVYPLARIAGGWYGNPPGAFGGQCIDRGSGSDRSHAFGVELAARRAGPIRLRVRYAIGAPGASVTVRLRRGETIAVERPDVRFAPTAAATWSWLDVDLGALETARYRVEFVAPSGTPEIDVVGLVPAPEK
jgi:hypothetical protein